MSAASMLATTTIPKVPSDHRDSEEPNSSINVPQSPNMPAIQDIAIRTKTQMHNISLKFLVTLASTVPQPRPKDRSPSTEVLRGRQGRDRGTSGRLLYVLLGALALKLGEGRDALEPSSWDTIKRLHPPLLCSV